MMVCGRPSSLVQMFDAQHLAVGITIKSTCRLHRIDRFKMPAFSIVVLQALSHRNETVEPEKDHDGCSKLISRCWLCALDIYGKKRRDLGISTCSLNRNHRK
jgi:hypothetical protein